MATFYEVFNPTQQFLLLQAYVDHVLTEAELLNFSLLTTTERVPLVFYSRGMLVITPAIDFADFSHVFFPAEELVIREAQENLEIIHGRKTWELAFQDTAEARQLKEDLAYLFSQE